MQRLCCFGIAPPGSTESKTDNDIPEEKFAKPESGYPHHHAELETGSFSAASGVSLIRNPRICSCAHLSYRFYGYSKIPNNVDKHSLNLFVIIF